MFVTWFLTQFVTWFLTRFVTWLGLGSGSGKPKRRKCAVEGCEKYSRGTKWGFMCSKHYKIENFTDVGTKVLERWCNHEDQDKTPK